MSTPAEMIEAQRKVTAFNYQTGMIPFGLITPDALAALLKEREELKDKLEHEASISDELLKLNTAHCIRADQWRECAEALHNCAPSGLQCDAFHHSRKDRHDGHEDCPCVERFIQARARFEALKAMEGGK